MDRKGFISISVVYTLFIVLLMLLLSILAGYVNKRLLLKVNKGDISEILINSEDNRNIATVCRGQYLGNCFSKNSNLDKDLYHHDGKDDSTYYYNRYYEANDDSYRYAGANPHNFVCIDNQKTGACEKDNLYRIIGFFPIDNGNYAAKLIKNESIGKIAWVGNAYEDEEVEINNSWWDSNLKTYLNDETNSPLKSLIPYIMEDYWCVAKQKNRDMVKNRPWEVYKYEKFVYNIDDNLKMEIIAKVGLMYISDYMYAAAPEAWSYVGDKFDTSYTYDYSSAVAINWLAGLDEYVLTSVYGEENNQVFYLQSGGKVGVSNVSELKEVRPVFSILPNIIVESGIGIKTDPYRLTITVS